MTAEQAEAEVQAAVLAARSGGIGHISYEAREASGFSLCDWYGFCIDFVFKRSGLRVEPDRDRRVYVVTDAERSMR
mgnify:CR=1 FL=1